MQISENIFIVASGSTGVSMTNAADCTVYLLDGGEECALLDAGVGIEPDRILCGIEAAGFALSSVKKIFLTHGHGDHAGGAAALSKACGAQVYAMEPAASFVSRGDTASLSIDVAVQAGVYGADYRFEPCAVLPLADGQMVRVGKLALTVLATEGHSAGHCCYLLQKNGALTVFSGDSVFCGGKIALQAIWDCDLQKYFTTIRKLAALHPETLLPAHGCFALQRGYAHTDKALAALEALLLPNNTIGE